MSTTLLYTVHRICIRTRGEYTVKYIHSPEGVPDAKPKGTSEGKGVYLTGYPESSPNRTVYHFNSHKANNSLKSLIDN